VYFDVEEHDGARRVVVPDVVVDLLEVPAVLPCRGVDGDDRGCEEIVAGPDVAVVVGRGVAGREIQQAELRIDRRCLPDRRAAVLPGAAGLRPGVVTDLAGAGDRVAAPQLLASLRVER